jgi:hypothetical protein
MMDREEWETPQSCVACGGPVSEGTERGFSFGLRNTLCWSCAIARGGRFDAERDTWTEAPDITDLPDDAYGEAVDEKPGS